LATLAHGDGVCTTVIPIKAIPGKAIPGKAISANERKASA
jgi:hypothetical protein